MAKGNVYVNIDVPDDVKDIEDSQEGSDDGGEVIDGRMSSEDDSEVIDDSESQESRIDADVGNGVNTGQSDAKHSEQNGEHPDSDDMKSSFV